MCHRFMPMDVNYSWVLSAPDETASVFMANRISGERVFKASLDLKRKEISAWSLASVLCRYPFQTVRTIFAIHWQALRLWLKRRTYLSASGQSSRRHWSNNESNYY